jgi:N-formylglutamate amidohydrolase
MTDSLEIEGVLTVLPARGTRVPVVYDSPHSGEVLPPSFEPVAPDHALRSGVDMFVDELFGAAPANGSPLLSAHFPRTFIDANRAEDDIDPGLIDGDWTRPLNPTKKSEKGFGLLRTLALPGYPVHAGPLPVAEIENRIDNYYRPYHAALRRLLDETYESFGAVWHIDCHSMKSVGTKMNDDPGAERADFVISDSDGTTSEPEFTQLIAETLRDAGYKVNVNDPYKGAALIQLYSDPPARRHSVQIEINRRLYMIEDRYEKSDGFPQLRYDLDHLVETIADWTRSRL